MNETHVTVVGNVVADPVRRVTRTGDPYVTLRVASTVRRFDPATAGYVDGDTNFVDVRAYRRLARHVAESVTRGDPVVVAGRLRVRPWSSGERSGTAVEIDAATVGHDLTWGTARFRRGGAPGTVPGPEVINPVGGPDEDGTRFAGAAGAVEEEGGDDGADAPAAPDTAPDTAAVAASTPVAAPATTVGDPEVDAYEVES